MLAESQCGPQCGGSDRTHIIQLKNKGKSEVLALTALCSASALKNENDNSGLASRVRARPSYGRVGGGALKSALRLPKATEATHAQLV